MADLAAKPNSASPPLPSWPDDIYRILNNHLKHADATFMVLGRPGGSVSIMHRANANDIRAEAKKNGMKTIEDDGFAKINLGLTSIEEVLRITMAGGF